MSGFSVAPGAIVLGQSGVAVPLTGGTGETTLATITLPAGAMGANGQIVMETQWSWTNSANNKTPKVKFGASTVYGLAHTTTAGLATRQRLANRGAANSQVGVNGASDNFYGGSLAVVTYAVDTSASVDITITGQLALGTETMTLESYQVLLYPKG